MTQHFSNRPPATSTTASDFVCGRRSIWRDGDKNKSGFTRVFHESGHVRFYLEADGRRMEELACIHCGRVFDGDSFGQDTDKTLTGAA